MNYKHNLGEGFTLNAYTIDPMITQENLKEIISSNEKKSISNLNNLINNTKFIEKIDSLDKFKIHISNKRYNVPKQLQSYREGIQFQGDSIGRYNGPVLIVNKEVQNPLKCFKGGFYDFIATKLDAIPSKLENEFRILNMLSEDSLFWKIFSKVESKKRVKEIYNKLKGQYKAGKTIKELFKKWDINPNKRAKYFGLSYLLCTQNGKEISFVQRAKNMAVAADCISNPGSTPNPPFNEKKFNIHKYLKKHIINEMYEEYKIKSSEFSIKRLFLFDDPEVSFANIEMITSLSTMEIAKRIYGNPDSIKEHPIVYSIDSRAINKLMGRFEMHTPFIQTLKIFQKYK